MISYQNTITQKIFQIIAPLIGELMAAGVLKSQAKKIGVTEETLMAKHLPQLSVEIQRGLTTFIGSDAAARIAEKIKNIS